MCCHFPRNTLFVAAFCFLLAAVGPAAAQEQGAEQPPPAKETPAAAATEKSAPPALSPKEQSLQALRQRAQQSDIATASYFELQQLARRLQLDSSGDSASLRRALYAQLQLKEPPARGGGKDDLVLSIESAHRARAFTVEKNPEDSEDYFRISGGVRLLISDKRAGLQHRVQADSIMFNRAQNTIRAEGQVLYLKKKLNAQDDKDTEKFTGDSLVFRLRLWRGLIFYGVFSRQQTTKTPRPADIHSKSSNPEKTEADPAAPKALSDETMLGKSVLSLNEIRFHFAGERVRKGQDDILLLERGAISTGANEQQKYFSLGFRRLWIFGQPEWAMLSATLYVGHIPVLYLPYYYHNDSQLLFHPVFGLREAYGEFVQTTTYLLGKPPAASTDSLSFLPVNAAPQKDAELQLDALYLVPKAAAKDSGAAAAAAKKTAKGKLGKGSYVKFLLDYYSYIGLFTGFNGQFKNLGPISSLSFAASLAYSYALEERDGASFAKEKPFILGADNRYTMVPIESSFLGQTIPFRFGFDTKISSKEQIVSLDFKYYSDPFYNRDYANRKESFDWIGYALERVQRDADSLLEELRKKKAVLSSYNWELGLNLRPKFATQLLSSVVFKAYGKVYFSKKTDADRPVYDPTREFFYPGKLFLPDTSLRLSGTLWPLKKSGASSAKPQTLPLLQDWKYQPGDKTSGKGEDEQEAAGDVSAAKEAVAAAAPIIAKPQELQKIKQAQQVKIVSFKANYDLSLQNLFQSKTDNKEWQRLEEVHLNNKELHFTGKEALQFSTSWAFLDSLVTIDLRHNLDINVSHYFGLGDWQTAANDLPATKQANKWQWHETSNVVLKPLHLFDWFASSTVSHSLKVIMYDYKYEKSLERHEGSFLDLELADEELRQRITTHSLTSLLDFRPLKNAYNPVNNLHASVSFASNLPPSLPKNTIQFQFLFEMFHWSHSLSLKLQQAGEDDPEYYAQPLTYTSIYKPLDKLELKNVLIYNFEDKKDDKNKDIAPHLDKEEFTFKAWWFSGGLYFRYTQPYAWDKDTLRWQAENANDKKELLADKIFLAFDLTTKDYYFWKNRLLFYFMFKARWDQNLIRYNQKSALTVDFRFSFFIYEFLNIQISYRMSNEKLYLYYPGMQEILGFSQRRFILEDLWHSLSFWDQEKQKNGLFKMKDISFLAIHHLKDWDLILEFIGKPRQVEKKLQWNYSIGLYLRWIPIPLIKRRFTFEDEILNTDAR